MKKILLTISCLLIAIILLPGGMASWGDTLNIEGDVSVAEPEPELEAELESEAGQNTDFERDYKPNTGSEPELEPGSGPGESEDESVALCVLSVVVIGQGSTTPAAGYHEFEEGTKITLEAKPAEGWQFDRWVLDKEEYQDSSIVITVKDNIELSAVFVEVSKLDTEPKQEPDSNTGEGSEAESERDSEPDPDPKQDSKQ